MIEALQPPDEFNRRLQSHAHPDNHRNPTPAPRYNLVVIGAGPAGLVAASVAAGLGAKVALIERSLMGGDCLNVGCVPSKALIAAARAVSAVRKAERFGIRLPAEPEVDFPRVMERMRRLRAEISPHDSVERFTRLGVDVFIGSAAFTDASTVEVAGERLRFAKAVICTGARAAKPDLDGINALPYLTNETLFSLTELPARLGIIGAGPIGAEMAQCFARFGSQVTVVASERGLLPNEDRDAAAIVRASLERDGVRIVASGARHIRLSSAAGGIRLHRENAEHGFDLPVDHLLVAAGRAPNVEGLGLEAAGIAHTAAGVMIDDHFRTTNPKVYAAGDVCSPHRFTHAADFMARAVVRNALFLGRVRHSALIVPRATYTSPELAHIGHTAASAQAANMAVTTFTQPLDGLDRSVLEDEAEGFVRVHTCAGTDEIVGATIVAARAGDLIGEYSLAMTRGIGLGRIARTIHPYPTVGEAIRKTGDLYQRDRLTPFMARLIRGWLRWTR